MERIECNGKDVDFHLSDNANADALPAKLIEPQFGVTFIKENGDLDLVKTTGPFSLVFESPREIKLKISSEWQIQRKKWG